MGKAGRERNGAMTVAADKVATTGRHMGSPLEVLLVFLKLGVSCFGGPIAHIGYFREEFVVRRRWIDEQAYVDLVALCQFLPGPASSQVGFSIGLLRGGYRGALAAWTGFTLPSAIVLVLFAYGAGALERPDRNRPASWSQARRRRHCSAGRLGHGAHTMPGSGAGVDRGPERTRHSVQHLVRRSDRGHPARLRFAGLWLCRGAPPPTGGYAVMPVSRRAGVVALTAFYCFACWAAYLAGISKMARHRTL